MRVASSLMALSSVALAGRIIEKQGKDVIDGEFVVVFEKGKVEALKQAVYTASATRGVRIMSEYNINDSFLGFAAHLDEQALQVVAALDGVDFVEPNVRVHADQSFPSCSTTQLGATWGLARSDGAMEQTTEYNYNEAAGRGVNAYIFDTGVQCDAHESEFVSCSHGFCADGFANCEGDGHGHGTHVAGTVASASYGIAKAANIVNVKVLSDFGSGSTAGIVAGINWAAEHNRGSNGVSNMSLGGGVQPSMNLAVDAAHEAGLVMVVSAGNDAGDSCQKSPASATNAVTVGSTDDADRVSSFSNQGTCNDIFGPGSSITSLGTTSGSTRVMSGTSMSSPHLAGAVAVLRGANALLDADATVRALYNNGIEDVVTGVSANTDNLFINTC